MRGWLGRKRYGRSRNHTKPISTCRFYTVRTLLTPLGLKFKGFALLVASPPPPNIPPNFTTASFLTPTHSLRPRHAEQPPRTRTTYCLPHANHSKSMLTRGSFERVPKAKFCVTYLPTKLNSSTLLYPTSCKSNVCIHTFVIGQRIHRKNKVLLDMISVELTTYSVGLQIL